MKTMREIATKGCWQAAITARAYGTNATSEWRRGGGWVQWYLLSLMKSLDYSRRARRVRRWAVARHGVEA